MISLNDVLLAMSNIPVDDPIAEIWGRGLQGGYRITEYTGSLPITITANGDALLDYRIFGADGGVGVATESGEPAGYKLPMVISDGNTEQTAPVYIGENQLDSVEGVSDYVDKSSGKIVRMIGEHTFTGDENVSRYGSRVHRILLAPAPLSTANIISTRCSHFTAIRNMSVPNFTNTAEYTCIISSDSARFCVNYLGDLKVYFKEQYDNGTPVKVWYVLETPIEEDPPVPFPDIPTIKGETVIDYDGEPKPSQMYVKYKGKSGGA